MSRVSKPTAATNAAVKSAPLLAARPRGVLADDHAVVTDGLRSLLEPEYAIVAVVADGEALIEAVRSLRPDFVVADISMPLRNGIDAIREIIREHGPINAICLTMHSDRMYLAEALGAGAAGFVAKHAASSELRQAIKAVLRGGSYISPLVGGRGAVRGRPFATDTAARGLFKLTSRQRQVLQLVAEGRTVREVASVLGVTPKTVEFHKYRIIDGLGLKSSAAMIQFAVEHGLVSG
jgi:DNA-binding NarL/FixJ family response regulator